MAIAPTFPGFQSKLAISPEDEHPRKALGWAARDCGGRLSHFSFSRRDTGPEDVAIKVLFCGICHSDIHSVKNEWGNSNYPLVPGHEIAGQVTEVGNKVTKFKVGDKVGLGCMARSCETCDSCIDNLENYCPKAVFTYNSFDYDGTKTYGGFSNIMVAPERYVVRMPENLPLSKCGPLLCAGITVYSALKYYGLTEPGMHIGVVGLGGLGHVAVKFAKAFGLKVTVISTSPDKKRNAIDHLGADGFIFSNCHEEMLEFVGTLDGIIDTASAAHPILPLIGLLKNHRKMVMVGEPSESMKLPEKPVAHGTALHTGRKTIAGSCIGGMKETQEMMDFAGEHNITPDIELISMAFVNKAIAHVSKGKVSFRYVIDMEKTLSEISLV